MAIQYLQSIHVSPQRQMTKRWVATAAETREISQTINDAAVLLYNHYLYLATAKSAALDYQDSAAAQVLGWDEGKTKRIRRKLEAAGFILMRRYKNYGGAWVQELFVGKKTIAEMRQQDELNIALNTPEKERTPAQRKLLEESAKKSFFDSAA